MAEEKNKNKIIGFVLAVIILIAIFTIIYVNLPEETEKKDESLNGEKETIFSLKFRGKITNYSLEDLESLEEFTGMGTYIKSGWLPDVVLDGPTNFTGIRANTLLNQIDNLPNNYSIVVYSSDDWITEYNKSAINGQVEIYNESGNITQTGGVTMLFAYKKEGDYLTDTDDGPLQIAFINDNKITSSKLWAKMVVSIELIDQS
ncbi:hypothetical protein AYK21_03155 [Thermoplasmatales archaeon SG8-52-2]|nr:MAG: hypothetical protein AYK21_03155 [Thermoplasmatales archaeon SG8-52-2]